MRALSGLERLTSGRRDAFQLFAGAGTGVAFAIVWQEDPKGLRPGEGEGPRPGLPSPARREVMPRVVAMFPVSRRAARSSWALPLPRYQLGSM